jgi:hypothetical protein
MGYRSGYFAGAHPQTAAVQMLTRQCESQPSHHKINELGRFSWPHTKTIRKDLHSRVAIARDANAMLDQPLEISTTHPHDTHDTAPGPCPACTHWERCRAGQACEAFALFVKAGGTQRWRLAPRQPSRQIFVRVFRRVRRRRATAATSAASDPRPRS